MMTNHPNPIDDDSEKTKAFEPSTADDATLLPHADSAPHDEYATLDQSQSGQAIEPPSRPHSIKYFGDYEILSEIARGGMGVVYKARQSKLNRIVAVKMILSGELASQEAISRFFTEAQAAATLDHPGIVPVYEIGEHEGKHYFTMGYIEGKSLAEKVNQGPLPPKEAAEMTRKIAEAIAYAHSKGVIHRDLKPANVLLDANGEPKVSDFGLARKIEQDSGLTRTGAVMGTPSYMPPEQAAGKTSQVGPLSDVYSLGAILYCLLTGRPPFQAANPLDTMMQVIEKEPVSVQTLNSGVPKDLETICHKCLQKDPAKRYASAQEFADDLQRWLKGEPIRARAVSSSERAWRWVKRHKAISSLCAVTLLSILAGSLVSVVYALRANREYLRANRESQSAIAALATANFSLAVANTNFGKQEEAIQNLYSIPAMHRNVEWQLARLPLAGKGKICYFHKGEIKTLVLSEDGSMVASTDSKNVIIFDLRRNKTIMEIPLSHDWEKIDHLSFSADSKTLAISGSTLNFEKSSKDDKVVVSLWDLESSKEKLEIRGDGFLNSIAFSPDGSKIAGSRGKWHTKPLKGQIWIWSTSTGDLIDSMLTDDHYAGLSFSPDGTELYANRTKSFTSISFGNHVDVTVRPDSSPSQVYRINIGAKSIVPFEINGHEINWLSDEMSISDGKFILSARPYISDQYIEAIPFDNLAEKKKIDTNGSSKNIVLTDVGERIFWVSKDRRILSWEIKPGKKDLESTVDFSRITKMRIHPNGFHIITGHQNGSVKINSLNSIQAEFKQLSRETCNNLYLSSDGREYWGLSEGAICAWNTNTGEKTQSINVFAENDDAWDSHFMISKDGSKGLVAHGSGWSTNNVPLGRFELWDLQAGKLIHSFQHEGAVTNTKSISFTPDEKQVVCVMKNGLIRFWDINAGRMDREFSHMALTNDDNEARVIKFLPGTGEMIISTGVKIWKGWPTNWERAVQFEDKWGDHRGVGILESTRDGRLLATSDGNSIVLYDTKSKKILCSARNVDEYLGEMNSFAFSPDGLRLVSLHGKGNGPDSRLVVWETADLTEVYRTTIPKVTADSRIVFHDRSSDFCLGTDRGLYRLDTQQGDRFVVPNVRGENPSLEFSNDEKFLKISSPEDYSSNQIYECYSVDTVQRSLSEFDPTTNTNMWTRFQARSPYGKWVAIGESSKSPIQLISGSSFVSESDVKKSMEDAVLWHKKKLAVAIKNRDMTSEVFHLAWILKDDPENATKYDDLHDAYDRLVADSKTIPLLSFAVADALKLPRGNSEPPLTEEAAKQFVIEAWEFTGAPQEDSSRRWLLANSKLEKLGLICERYPQPFFWAVLGAVYIRRSEPRKAIEALSKATSLLDAKSTPTISHILLAMAHEQLGDLDAASRYLDQVDAHPDHLQAISKTSQSLYFEACSTVRKTPENDYSQPIADFNLQGTFDRLLSQRWEVAEGIAEQTVFHRCPDKKRSGQYSMHLRPYQVEKNVVRKRIAVEPGTRYRFSVECYPSAIVEGETSQAEAAKQPTVSFLVQDSQASVTHTPMALDWEKVNLEFTTQPDQTSVTIEIKFDAQGASNHNGVWLDDFRIEKIE